jgi:TetR/AcrR family transcriptional regulator
MREGFMVWSRGKGDPAAGDALSKAPILKVLRQVLNCGVREGRIARGLETRHLLIHLIGLCLIYFSNRYTLSRSIGLNLHSAPVLKKGINQVIRLLRHGILRPSMDRSRRSAAH